MKMKFVFFAAAMLNACAAQIPEDIPVDKTMQLAGSEWGFAEPEAATEKTFILFGADAKVIGFAGCNRMGGSYEQTGSAIRIGSLFSTKRACEADIMAEERRFMQALNAARSIEATHFKLRLFDEVGTELLSLRRRDWD